MSDGIGAKSAVGKGVGIMSGILVGSGVNDLAPPLRSLFPASKICAICSSAAAESSSSLSTPLSVIAKSNDLSLVDSITVS